MRRTSKPCCRAGFSLVRRTSRITASVVVSVLGVVVVVIDYKFFGCANHRKVNLVLRKASSDSLSHVRVGNVFAVPSEEELHLVDGRRGNLDSISGSDRR